MNEILDYYDILDEKDDSLSHYGVKRRSGRYPWGSGDNPYQRSGDFLARVELLKKSGLSEVEISKEFGITTNELRAYASIARDERRYLEVARARSLKEDGLSVSEIGRRMGKNESSIRSLLDKKSEVRMNQSRQTADILKKIVDEKGMVDVGAGVELDLDISKEKMAQALAILEADGYSVYGIGVRQITNPNQQTNVKVLTKPGISYKDVYQNSGKIEPVKTYINPESKDDNKDIIETYKYPSSLDSKRIKIRYAEEGGKDKDGIIELRRGVEDISLGNSSYAQVRVLVDNKYYLKGMAMYSDDMPDGTDVIFNTNKKVGTEKEKVFKPISTADPDNPFGSYIKSNGQRTYIDKSGKEKLSVINKVREEGDWNTWSKNLSSQMLVKQNLSLIKKQLDLTYSDKLAEYDEILQLTNPTVKKNMLQKFADTCDSASVHLQAVSLPRQKVQVLLPINTLNDTEVYAPNFKNGEKIALIRYPHGGTFEIPILTVNNKHKDAKSILGNAVDGIGINSNVAERLSGADFDGDFVVAIPTNSKVQIKSTDKLKDLENFDTKSYSADTIKTIDGVERYFTDGVEYKIMKNTQTEMGKISNLITDMTIKGASTKELARAVKHSMVVIDAEKHKLNYKKSAADNDISSLRKLYQGHINADGKYSEGASTIISRASSETQVPKRVGSPRIDPKTGEKIFKEVHETYTDKNGKVILRTTKSTKMAEAKDARSLSSGTVKEEAYAEYANKVKALANKARLEMLNTENKNYDPRAKRIYSEEVSSLNSKLNIAEKNAPKERRAQLLANSNAAAKKNSNPNMSKDEYNKIKQRELINARVEVGASGKDSRINITPKEWEAIQAGAISSSKLNKILVKADPDLIRSYATPKVYSELSSAKLNLIKSMSGSGYTISEIADRLGVSTSTVSRYIK